MHVTQSRRHVRAAVAAAALIATGGTVAGIGATVANADAVATSAPARYQGSGNLFTALQFPTLPSAESAPAEAAEQPAAEPAPEAAPVAQQADWQPVAQETAAVQVAAEAPAEPAAPAPAPLAVTAEELGQIVPQVPADKIAAYIQPLNDAMAHGGIDTPLRQAAFIAQLAVESDSFRTFEEYASGAAYEGRSDLGNTQAGDGVRYKGRGAIQVTGRHNYEEVSKYTGIDFIAHPEQMADPANAFSTAVWYWTSRNLNGAIDLSGIVRVSELVNGGHHGLAERMANFARGLAVLSQS